MGNDRARVQHSLAYGHMSIRTGIRLCVHAERKERCICVRYSVGFGFCVFGVCMFVVFVSRSGSAPVVCCRREIRMGTMQTCKRQRRMPKLRKFLHTTHSSGYCRKKKRYFSLSFLYQISRVIKWADQCNTHTKLTLFLSEAEWYISFPVPDWFTFTNILTIHTNTNQRHSFHQVRLFSGTRCAKYDFSNTIFNYIFCTSHEWYITERRQRWRQQQRFDWWGANRLAHERDCDRFGYDWFLSVNACVNNRKSPSPSLIRVLWKTYTFENIIVCLLLH